MDIRAKLPASADLSRLESIGSDLGEHYPKRDGIYRGEFGVREPDPNSTEFKPITALDTRCIGYVYRHADRNLLTQFRLDGFTYNWLPPYNTWDDLRREASLQWEVYASGTEPEVVTRLALRYINALSLPFAADFDDYLAAGPVVPQALPQLLDQFLTRLTVPDPEIDSVAHITQSLERTSADEQTISVVLDVDVFKTVNLEWRDHEAIWREFELLHDFKNRVFFGSITERTARQYE